MLSISTMPLQYLIVRDPYFSAHFLNPPQCIHLCGLDLGLLLCPQCPCSHSYLKTGITIAITTLNLACLLSSLLLRIAWLIPSVILDAHPILTSTSSRSQCQLRFYTACQHFLYFFFSDWILSWHSLPEWWISWRSSIFKIVWSTALFLYNPDSCA